MDLMVQLPPPIAHQAVIRLCTRCLVNVQAALHCGCTCSMRMYKVTKALGRHSGIAHWATFVCHARGKLEWYCTMYVPTTARASACKLAEGGSG